MKKVRTKRGAKIFIKDKHVKTISGRYYDVIKMTHIRDFSKKRLTHDERLILEYELLKRTLTGRMKEEAEKVTPVSFVFVNVRNGSNYYEIETSTPEIIFKIEMNNTHLAGIKKINRLY